MPRRVGKITTVTRDDTPKIAATLRTAGLRRTPVRVAVLAAVATSRKPLAAPEIIRRLTTDTGIDTDPVTVYRTLNTLAEHKLLHRIRGDDGAWRYASTPVGDKDHHDHPHAHFVCDACGNVECLERLPMPDHLARPTTLGRRYDVTYAELVVHGTCPKCHD
jgi:Fe2+ or Zn2+ uptake regulation protein